MHLVTQKLDARATQLERDVAYFRALAATNAGAGAQPALTAHSNAVSDADSPNPPAQADAEISTRASAKRSVTNAFTAEGTTMPGRIKHRKKLEVKIPGKATGQAPGLCLPTPMPSVSRSSSQLAVGLTHAGSTDSAFVGSWILVSDDSAHTLHSRSNRST